MLAFLTSQPPLSKSTTWKKKRQVSTDIVTEENRMEKHPEKDSGLKRK